MCVCVCSCLRPLELVTALTARVQAACVLCGSVMYSRVWLSRDRLLFCCDRFCDDTYERVRTNTHAKTHAHTCAHTLTLSGLLAERGRTGKVLKFYVSPRPYVVKFSLSEMQQLQFYRSNPSLLDSKFL